MDIRKVDDKGRITVGSEQSHYSVTRHEDGSIALQPLPEIPTPPRMDRQQMRAVYVDVAGAYGSQPPTVTIFSQMPNQARFIARIAEECMVPIVVSGGGVGTAIADRIKQETEQQVIVMNL